MLKNQVQQDRLPALNRSWNRFIHYMLPPKILYFNSRSISNHSSPLQN